MKTNQIEKAWNGAERCKQCAIRHLALFSDLQHEDFDRIHYPIDEIDFKPGSVIFHQGDEMRFVYTIRSGLVKLIQHMPNGDYRIVRLLKQGDLAGLESLNDDKSDYEAVTMEHVRVCRIPKTVLETLRRDTPRIHDALILRWYKALNSADNWLTRLSTGNARKRVAQLLLLLDESSDDEVFFLPTREDMGAMLGITTESVSKVTADFSRKNWLKSLQHHYAWIDRNELESII